MSLDPPHFIFFGEKVIDNEAYYDYDNYYYILSQE